MIVEVAAAVLERGDGAFLLAQRPAGKVYAGFWEFPGGKVEAGEPAHAALARELREELGIEVVRAYPWITRVFTYPHATVRLNFFRVLEWRGEPSALEDQAIAWQRAEAAMAEPMLPANAPVLASLALPHEYAITDAGSWGTARMLGLLEEKLGKGLRLVQVREPGLTDEECKRFTAQVIGLARRYGAKVMVKSPFEGADGLHVTADALMGLGQRPAVPLAAASCHTRAELERAMELGFDFAVAGPVKATATHPDARPLGWDGFRALARRATLPVYAIGGLTRADLEHAWRAGAHGVAMVRGSWG